MDNEDEIVVMVVLDYQMLGSMEKIASKFSDDPLWTGDFSFYNAFYIKALHHLCAQHRLLWHGVGVKRVAAKADISYDDLTAVK